MNKILDSLRQQIALKAIFVGRMIFKNTRIEKSKLAIAVYQLFFKLGFSGKTDSIRFEFHGQSFVTNSQDKSMLPGLLNQTYELQEISFFMRVLKEGEVFLDIGANIGLYSKIASHIVGPSGQVHAFEPSPQTRKYLEENLNNLQNVHIVPKAVGSESGELNLYLNDSDMGCNSLLATTDHFIKVPVTTVDEYLLSNPTIQRIDFIKMDIEGFEEDALKGMTSALKYNPTIMIEFNPEFLRANHRDPDLFLLSLKRQFGSVRFIHEKSGELLGFNSLKDLHHQLIANLVLENAIVK